MGSAPFMIQEIREQPDLVDRVLEAGREAFGPLANGDFERAHFVGCGDMHFAAELAVAVGHDLWGVPLRSWRSMDLRWGSVELGKRDLVVCASVSGRTPRTLEAARLARSAGARVLGITDNESSPLGAEVDEVMILATAPQEELTRDPYAGYQHVVPQTKTFLAAWTAEMLVAATLGADPAPLRGFPEIVARACRELEARVDEVAEAFVGRERVAVIGSGPHRPCADYGRAKFLELAVPAVSQCLEEYNHLEIFLADETWLAIHLACDGSSAHRVEELTGAWESVGLKSLVVTDRERTFPGAGTRTLVVPGAGLLETIVGEIVSLQYLACFGGTCIGRDVDRWLGGCRTNLFQDLSLKTIRGSRIRGVSDREILPDE